MAIGVKRNETRGWPWAYVGDVAIHAARLRWADRVPEYALPALQVLWAHRHRIGGDFKDIKELYDALPFGAVVCVVRKTGCLSTHDDNGDDRSLTPDELACGDYSPGRWYFPTTNLRRLTVPVLATGRQGPFDLPPAVLPKVLASISTRA